MKELVNHILYIANLNNKKITHMQLHKIAYFTLGYLIREKFIEEAKKMYEEEKFQAWLYGPVLPEVYKKYKKYSSTHIIDSGKKSVNFEKVPHINDVILNLMNQNVFDLVRISHSHEFWKKHKKIILNNKKPYYNFEVLSKEFVK